MLLIASILFFSNCSKQPIEESIISHQTIQLSKTSNENFPYTDTQTLNSYRFDKSILNYQYAKKLALIDMMSNHEWQDMKWEGASLSETPVVIYGFDSKPKYYEYIVLDPENRGIGSVIVYAQKKSNGIVRSISREIPDFNTKITKNGSIKLLQDWAGNTYTANIGKSGESPSQVVDNQGQNVSNMKEYSDPEIAKMVAKDLWNSVGKSLDSMAEFYKDSADYQ